MKGIEGAFQDLTVFLGDLAVITWSYEQRNDALFRNPAVSLDYFNILHEE
jgi:hypothetical protein